MSADKIRELNDKFRANPHNGLGRFVFTRGVTDEGTDFVTKCLQAVMQFSDFNADNDPHSEHDFFAFVVNGIELNFKVDYYDTSLSYHSPNAADPTVTVRVGTIMKCEDY